MKSLDELAKKIRDREVAVALLEKSNEIGEMIDNGKLEELSDRVSRLEGVADNG
jgi:hypothetical protein